MPSTRVEIKPLTDVEARVQEFLDEQSLLPLGVVTIFAGRGGVGKTTFALDYVAKVSNGTLPGKHFGEPQKVLVIGHEDDAATQLKPRLMAANVKEENVLLLSMKTMYGDQEVSEMPLINRDWPQLQIDIAKHRPALIVIDPLTSAMEGDLHKVQDVRRALTPLSQIAQENNLSVIALTHFNKGAGSVSDKVTGSHAFRDAARSVLLFARDSDTETVVVTVDKSNYSVMNGYNFHFKLENTEVNIKQSPWDLEIAQVARVKLLGESKISVADLTRRELQDPGELSETESWLQQYLGELGGSAPSIEVKSAGRNAGFSNRTLERAVSKLCTATKSGFPAKTVWSLRGQIPPAGRSSASSANTNQLGESGGIGETEPLFESMEVRA